MTHPGILVRQECLDPHGLSVTDAAQVLGCNRHTVSNLLNGRSDIPPEMAARPENASGTSAHSRMEQQMTHELDTVMARPHKIELRLLTRQTP